MVVFVRRGVGVSGLSSLSRSKALFLTRIGERERRRLRANLIVGVATLVPQPNISSILVSYHVCVQWKGLIKTGRPSRET